MPATDAYLQEVGLFVWNFSLVEWDAVYLTVKLNNDDWKKAMLSEPSSQIAKALRESIDREADNIAPEFVARLRAYWGHYDADVRERNGLLHAHPYTAAGGAQQLGGDDRNGVHREWTLEKLQAASAVLLSHHREGNRLLHEYVRGLESAR